jgi:hypothetical protein
MGKKRLKTKHPLYKKWCNMRHRCRKQWHCKYDYYGGRGIDVCDEWHDDFWAYVDYIEALPHAYEDGRTIDRIDNDKGYFPGNVRWATHSEQMANRRRYGKGYYKNKNFNKKPWLVQPVIKGKQTYGGIFATEEEAKVRVAEMYKEYEE